MGDDMPSVGSILIKIDGQWMGRLEEATEDVLQHDNAPGGLSGKFECSFTYGRIPVLWFTPEFYRKIGVLERKMARALARSRRNNGTVKRCAHGRTQRTRRSR